MKKVVLVMAVLGIIAMPLCVMAEDLIGDAKALLKQETLDSSKKALDLAIKAVQQQPQSYEANWVVAKAYRLVGDETKKANLPNWKVVCKENGKKGMQYAEKAISIDPNKVDGHFWFACSVGTYSDGVSILTALKEGLKDKTQKGFETSYKIDKMYNDAGPVLAIGRFWSVLPWPLNDKKKALLYLEEFQKYFPNKPEGQVYLGQAYLDVKDKTKAKAILEKATSSNDKYYSDMAKKMLADM
jgi:tetratricopeptide (TPR) repeat protein